MGLKGIISIAGVNGLHKIIAQSKNGFVVESLVDKKRFPVSSTQQVSMLEDISIYTTGGDVKLKEVFLNMKGKTAEELKVDVNGKPEVIHDFFRKIVPDYDKERVYPSDIKKVIKWYALIKDIIDLPDENDEKEGQSGDEKPGEEVKKPGE